MEILTTAALEALCQQLDLDLLTATSREQLSGNMTRVHEHDASRPLVHDRAGMSTVSEADLLRLIVQCDAEQTGARPVDVIGGLFGTNPTHCDRALRLFGAFLRRRARDSR